jgi:hypothetical protein
VLDKSFPKGKSICTSSVKKSKKLCKHRSRCFAIVGGHDFFLMLVTKVPDMRTCQNEHNVLLNFPGCLSILLLQTSKTDNSVLDIDAIYNLKLRKV